MKNENWKTRTESEKRERCPTCGRLIARHADCEHCVRVASDAASDAARAREWRDWALSDYTAPAPPPPEKRELQTIGGTTPEKRESYMVDSAPLLAEIDLQAEINDSLKDRVVYVDHEDYGNGMRRVLVLFDNGYGVSVLKGPLAYASERGLEVAVMAWDRPDGFYLARVCYGTPITDDILTDRTLEETLEITRKVAGLENR